MDIFVINGFYMTMREKFVKKGASIHYLVVEWDEKDLSWEDFRGTVLGATDPTTAAEGSLRKTILDKYEDLKLADVPNVGDNGVHASASPFEGLCERLNWTGAKLEEDAFGKVLLEAGIPAETILKWTKDPTVQVDGKDVSLFDSVEDVNASECVASLKKLAGVESEATTTKNQAFVFVKPHANNAAVVELVKAKFAEVKITVTSEADIDGAVIDEKRLIDIHYGSIASKAALIKPKDLSVTEEAQKKFEDKFGLKWSEALAKGQVLNALDACAQAKVSSDELNDRWQQAKSDKELVKFGGGFYCAKAFKAPKAEEKKAEEPKKE